MGVHPLKQNASDQGAPDVAPRAAHEDVGDVADAPVHVLCQVFEGGAEDRDAHSLKTERSWSLQDHQDPRSTT